MSEQFSGMRLLLLLLLPLLATAQTQLDIERQGKRVDFLRPPFASPLRLGSTLPLTCTAGELYFLTSATPGNNIHVCYSNGNWAITGASGPAQVSIYAQDTLIASRSAITYQPSPGISTILMDTGGRISVQHNVNTAYVATHASLQARQSVRCNSTEASAGAHQCNLTPLLATITQGIVLDLVPDVDIVGEATLSVDLFDAKSIKLHDGTTNPAAGDIPAGALTPIWYDGTVWRVLSIRPGQPANATRPPCAVGVQGRIWHVPGAAGVKDTVTVCAKDAANTYAWRSIY